MMEIPARGLARTQFDNLQHGRSNMNRYEKGLHMLQMVDGQAGENVIASLRDIAPDFSRQLIECFGDIYGRPGLDLKTRELAVVAALTALGTATPQLRVHLHAALNVGCAPAEIIEVMMQMFLYAGFPASLNGLFTAREIFAEQGLLLSNSIEK